MMRGSLAALVASTTCLLLALVVCQSALASPEDFAIETGTASVSTPQAGAHPDFETVIGLKQDPASTPNLFGLKKAYGTLRDLNIDLPAGLSGNPQAVEHCSPGQLYVGECPNASQVGITKVYGYELTAIISEAVYLMEPPGGDVVARFGFYAGISPALIDVRLDPARHYAVKVTVSAAPPRATLVKAETTIWGVPADPSHDTERMTPVEALGGVASSPSRPPGGPVEAFMTNPSSCGTVEEVGFSVDSWELPELVTSLTGPIGPFTGCDRVSFTPDVVLNLRPAAPERRAVSRSR